MNARQQNIHVLDTEIMENATVDVKKALSKHKLPAYCEIAILEFIKSEVLHRVRMK